LIMGITFKENVSDIRNSKVINIYKELNAFGLENIDIYDPFVSKEEVLHEYSISMVDFPNGLYDVIIIAVAHEKFRKQTKADLLKMATKGAILVDIKGLYRELKSDFNYWSL
jgi:UDP-N-acetyl-D-glucosamine/UDP-N-acetyl-D-galactosamine dehydrogenase